MAEATDVQMADLVVCSACCCSLTSCYTKTPECFGCKREGMVLCCQMEQACCKCMSPGANDDQKCCVLFEGGSYCVIPTTCVQDQWQIFCLDTRCSIPCTDKVPCMFGCLPFCVLFADWKYNPACCAKAGDILPDLKKIDEVADVSAEELRGPGQQEMS